MTSSLPAIASQIALGLALGSFAGAWHFMSLRLNWLLFTRGKAASALALQLGRLALTGAVLLMLAHAGALALLSGMAGILLARTVAMRSKGYRP